MPQGNWCVICWIFYKYNWTEIYLNSFQLDQNNPLFGLHFANTWVDCTFNNVLSGESSLCLCPVKLWKYKSLILS